MLDEASPGPRRRDHSGGRIGRRPRGSGEATRRYTWAVVLMGVIGAALVPLFVFIARSRIESLATQELDAELALRRNRLQEFLDRALKQRQGSQGTPLDPSLLATWKQLFPVIEDQILSQTEIDGLSLKGQGWREPLRVGRFEEADVLTVEFTVPTGAGPGARIDAAARFHLPFLPGARERSDRARMVSLFTFGVSSLAIVLYILAALVILVNRAQMRLILQEREKGIRLAAMGEVAGAIAHEVRNPLNAVSLSVQYLERLAARAEFRPSPSDYARIHLELGKIRKVVDNFVKFARIRDLVLGRLDMGEVVDDVLKRLESDLEAAHVKVVFARAGDLALNGDREKLAQVVHAVVQNAIDAMRAGGGGELRIRSTAAGRGVRTTFRDNGPVQDETVIRNIFEPYFGAREDALGLGMTMARTLVESHGGTIEAAPAQGGGCVVTIYLPRKPR